MSVTFPKENQFRVEENPMKKLLSSTKIHGFEGNKRYFWYIATILKALILSGRTVYAYQTLNEPTNLAELVATYPVRFMAVWKLFHLYFGRKQVEYLVKTIHKEFWDFGIAGPKIKKEIKHRFMLAETYLFGQYAVAMFCTLLTVLFPLVDMPEGKRHLPNIIWTPFDTNPSPFYEIFYIILLYNLFLSVVANAVFDSIFLHSVQHLFVQLKLLKALLRNITEGIMVHSSDVEKFNSEYFQKSVMDRLKICTQHHSKLLSYGKTVEKFVNFVMVPQVLMTYAALVINGYILSVDHKEFPKTLMLSIITTSCLAELAIYAIQASNLKEQSISVINTIMDAEWYLFKSPIKKALVFIMLNTQKGLSFTAGGMMNINNAILITVIQNAFSAITLLRALINE